jgi:putative ABC transport system permease protein
MMFGHYALTLYRTLTRHRLYAALNVLGLAVGVAVFLVLLLDVRFETSFDRWIPGAANVYRVDETTTFPGRPPEQAAGTGGLVAPLLKADYPQIAAATRMVGEDMRLQSGGRLEAQKVYLVDPDFFRVLPLPLIRGAAAAALVPPDGIAISERMARKYFGGVDVIGRTLTLQANYGVMVYRVTAVFRDLPANTHLKLDMVARLGPAFLKGLPEFYHWDRLPGPTYLRFRNAADARAVSADLDNFLNRRAAGVETGGSLGPQPTKLLRLHLTPLTAIHFKDAAMLFASEPGVDARTVASLGVVGGLALAIAVLNYVNLATAQAASRACELAMRKVLGATRMALVGQLLAESTIVALVAVAVGTALVEAALPLVNAIGGSALSLRYVGAGGVGALLLALTVLVGLLAGAYPALLLSGLAPAGVLSAARAPGGGRLGSRVRSALVLLQFAAAIGFTITALVLYAQDRFVRSADLGFQRDGLILVDGLGWQDTYYRQGMVLAALRAVPGVERVTISPQEPNTNAIYKDYVRRPGVPGPAIKLQNQMIGADYWSTYGVKLIAGRALDERHGFDDVAEVEDLKSLVHRGLTTMINEAAVKALGFTGPQDALGKIIDVQMDGTDMAPATIVGVVRNVRFQSPHVPIAPSRYTYQSHYMTNAVAAIRYQGVTASQMMARLRAAWEDVVPDHAFEARTANSRLADYYRPDEQQAGLFTLGAAIAVAVACLGLYGLAAFTTASRTREVGIRKTLGASTGNILTLLVRQFLRPVLLANAIAWPLAWFAMRAWLQGFDQRIALSPVYFFAATALTLAIAIATVAGQALAVARAEPAQALRHE